MTIYTKPFTPSPPEVAGILTKIQIGDPDPSRICTSIVERSNLSIRTSVRRLTRLTNAFSKKWENLRAMLAIYFAYYNFLPHSLNHSLHSGNGSGYNEACLESGRIAHSLKVGTLDLILRIVSTAATLLLGIAASSLAYRQFKISQTKLKLDLYEKRLALVRCAHRFARMMADSDYDSANTLEAADKFDSDTLERYFVFDDDMWPLFGDLYWRGRHLAGLQFALSKPDISDPEVSKEHTELKIWFSDQAVDMIDIFQRDLSIKTPDRKTAIPYPYR